MILIHYKVRWCISVKRLESFYHQPEKEIERERLGGVLLLIAVCLIFKDCDDGLASCCHGINNPFCIRSVRCHSNHWELCWQKGPSVSVTMETCVMCVAACTVKWFLNLSEVRHISWCVVSVLVEFVHYVLFFSEMHVSEIWVVWGLERFMCPLFHAIL